MFNVFLSQLVTFRHSGIKERDKKQQRKWWENLQLWVKQTFLQKSNPKSWAELLHVIQNLILSGVANIQQQTFYVVACSLEFSYAHQNEADINQHILTKTHVTGTTTYSYLYSTKRSIDCLNVQERSSHNHLYCCKQFADCRSWHMCRFRNMSPDSKFKNFKTVSLY